jgi:hypothetical protein
MRICRQRRDDFSSTNLIGKARRAAVDPPQQRRGLSISNTKRYRHRCKPMKNDNCKSVFSLSVFIGFHLWQSIPLHCATQHAAM